MTDSKENYWLDLGKEQVILALFSVCFPIHNMKDRGDAALYTS